MHCLEHSFLSCVVKAADSSHTVSHIADTLIQKGMRECEDESEMIARAMDSLVWVISICCFVSFSEQSSPCCLFKSWNFVMVGGMSDYTVLTKFLCAGAEGLLW